MTQDSITTSPASEVALLGHAHPPARGPASGTTLQQAVLDPALDDEQAAALITATVKTHLPAALAWSWFAAMFANRLTGTPSMVKSAAAVSVVRPRARYWRSE
jgi:hypothetical protein